MATVPAHMLRAAMIFVVVAALAAIPGLPDGPRPAQAQARGSPRTSPGAPCPRLTVAHTGLPAAVELGRPFSLTVVVTNTPGSAPAAAHLPVQVATGTRLLADTLPPEVYLEFRYTRYAAPE